MTFINNQFPSSTPFMTGLETTSHVEASAPIACRKRKEMEAEMDEGSYESEERRYASAKGLRRLMASLPRSNEQAEFLPLPPELNVQMLANLGYMHSAPHPLPRDLGSFSRVSHSPTSSFSDFGGPSTPSDVAGSVESYFSKGVRRESSWMYPTFNIYPGHNGKAHAPGLLGMHMNPPSVGSADENGMQMDGMEEEVAPPPVHGAHCKSIPQLHVRSEPGVSSELWAFCKDCGTRSKVDSPPVSDALSYSP